MGVSGFFTWRWRRCHRLEYKGRDIGGRQKVVTLPTQRRAQSERIKRAPGTPFPPCFRRPCRPVGSPSPDPDPRIISGRMRRLCGYEAFSTLDSGRKRTFAVTSECEGSQHRSPVTGSHWACPMFFFFFFLVISLYPGTYYKLS